MSPLARREWRRLAGELYANKLLTAWDVSLFRAYCEAVATRDSASTTIADEGMTFTTSRGDVRPRPEVRIVQAANDQIRLMGERFGLDPLSRSRLIVHQPLVDVEDDLDKLLGGSS